MNKKTRFGFVLVLMLAFLLVSVVGVQARRNFLYLNWREAVPFGSGNPNMDGEANLDINAGQAQVCYTLRVFIYTGPWPPTGATINNAPAGANGPVVVDLNPQFGPLGNPYASACVTTSSSVVHDIQRNPTDYYLLVTDSDHPDGSARAQLTK